jgi:hypothetical protein
MTDRVSFSGDHLGLAEIAEHHKDLESSLVLYFSPHSPRYEDRFRSYAANEVSDELADRLDEADLTSSLTVLASIEAAFRIDYLQRCYGREKDPLSRAFRGIYKTRRQHAPLEEEILEAWADNSSVTRSIISDLRSVFRFRRWLAHGRYWAPKLGRRYDFSDVFAIANLTLRSFPFYGLGN